MLHGTLVNRCTYLYSILYDMGKIHHFFDKNQETKNVWKPSHALTKHKEVQEQFLKCKMWNITCKHVCGLALRSIEASIWG